MHPYFIDRIQLEIHTINSLGFLIHLVAMSSYLRVAAVLAIIRISFDRSTILRMHGKSMQENTVDG